MKKRSSKRRKRCKSCRELFEPDPHLRNRQRYCSEDACQRKRQRQNEKNWRQCNPDCLEDQYKLSRQWYKNHPNYSRQRRQNNPALAESNRQKTRIRMQKARRKKMFDKSKSLLRQLTGDKEDKYYLAKGRRWLCLRLTKASLLSRLGILGDNRLRSKQVSVSLPAGRLYEISKEVFNTDFHKKRNRQNNILNFNPFQKLNF